MSGADVPVPILVALGSNIEPLKHLRSAVRRLWDSSGLWRVSPVYESEAVAAPGSPPFLNAAVWLLSALPPLDLRENLLRPLEASLGRVRSADRNAPRTIDLDLVLYGDRVMSREVDGMDLPDPEIPLHAHLAIPLAAIAPEIRHPLNGKTLRDIAAGLAKSSGIRRLEEDLLAPGS